MKNAVNWFEIPVTDEARALKFYNSVYGEELRAWDMGEVRYHSLPSSEGGIGGALAVNTNAKPAAEGPTIYLNGGEDLQPMLERIEQAGGKVLLPKTPVNAQIGYMAVFIDSEGNRLALHSPN